MIVSGAPDNVVGQQHTDNNDIMMVKQLLSRMLLCKLDVIAIIVTNKRLAVYMHMDDFVGQPIWYSITFTPLANLQDMLFPLSCT